MTFSTNEKVFPIDIAEDLGGGVWKVGEKLQKEVVGSGFTLNNNKTRMSLKKSRQTVTGLVVNEKVNINQRYYRITRTMCHALFTTGMYYHQSSNNGSPTQDLSVINGRLAHIHFVKTRKDRPYDINKSARSKKEFSEPEGPTNLYKKFLFYKYFVAESSPIVVTEGFTDIIYLKCAIRKLARDFPNLAKVKTNGKVERKIKFLRSSKTTKHVLNLTNGTGGQHNFINTYQSNLKDYKMQPMEHPIIILCDNDDGSKGIFSLLKNNFGITININTTEPYYRIKHNLYIIKIPEGNPPNKRTIEDLFHYTTLNMPLDGKFFDQNIEDSSAWSTQG